MQRWRLSPPDSANRRRVILGVLTASVGKHISFGHPKAKTLHIRQSIAMARQQEENQHTLQKYLHAKLPTLHPNISLPENNAAEQLVRFVTSYIEHVPEVMEAISDITRHAGIYPFAKQFIDIVEAYFVDPAELQAQTEHGLYALIDEAYVAHRLVEEVNDRMMMFVGIPLSPFDMTLSNIVVHDILGEDFANSLDLAVHFSVESLFNSHELTSNPCFARFVEQHRRQNWQHEKTPCPCLAEDAAIGLQYATTPLVLH